MIDKNKSKAIFCLLYILHTLSPLPPTTLLHYLKACQRTSSSQGEHQNHKTEFPFRTFHCLLIELIFSRMSLDFFCSSSNLIKNKGGSEGFRRRINWTQQHITWVNIYEYFFFISHQHKFWCDLIDAIYVCSYFIASTTTSNYPLNQTMRVNKKKIVCVNEDQWQSSVILCETLFLCKSGAHHKIVPSMPQHSQNPSISTTTR